MKHLSTIALVACLWSCQHPLEKEEITDGYVPATSSFKIEAGLSVSQTNADFDQETIEFDATFNQDVSWTLTITGQESGAIKTFDGVSQTTTNNCIWDGSSDNVYFFKKGEKYDATLTFLGSDETEELTDSIQTTKAFNAILIGDFEIGSSALASPSTWWTFQDGDEVYVVGKQTDYIQGLQGDYYMSLGGTDYNSDYYIAGVGHNPIAPELTGSPEDIYLNTYINNNRKSSTQLSVQVIESDGDMWIIAANVTWTGWKLYSTPLSKLTLAPASSTGDGTLDPGKINAVQYVLLTGDTPGPSQDKEVHMDMISFTYDFPFDQNK